MDELSVSVQMMFRAVEMQRRRLAQNEDSTISEVRALARIAELPGISNSELAADLDLKPSTISTLVDGLVERDLVVRTEDPNNRRRLHLALTHQGATIASRIYVGFAAAVTAAAAQMEPEEVSALANSLRQLSIAMMPSSF